MSPQGHDLPPRTLRVPPEWSGLRLDRALSDLYPEVSRTRLQAWIKEGAILLDGARPAKPGVGLEEGQELACEPPEKVVFQVDPKRAAALEVLFEDEHLAVVNKPAGLLVHSGPGHSGETLADLAAARFGDLPEVQGEDRAGIVHRLDAQTSGVIVIAKTEPAAETLMGQFREREVKKRYTALCHGKPRFESDWIEKSIMRSERSPERMHATDEEGQGRESETFYRVVERFERCTLLDVEPRTGRTHQIRVHLESVGLPIVEDTLYRGRGAVRTAVKQGLGPGSPLSGRQFLHAAELAFTHPASGQRVVFEAPLAADLQRLLDWLRDAKRATAGAQK